MALQKNSGPLLTSLFKGMADLLPAKWRARVGTKQTDQENPTDILPDDLTAGLLESRVVQTRTDERKKTNFYLEGDLTTELVEQVMLPNGQIATRTEKLVSEGTALDVPESALQGEQNNLGNNYMEQSVLDATLPGPTIFTTRIDRDGEIISIAKTRKLISDIAEGEFIESGIWTRTYREGETDLVATEVVEARPIQVV